MPEHCYALRLSRLYGVPDREKVLQHVQQYRPIKMRFYRDAFMRLPKRTHANLERLYEASNGFTSPQGSGGCSGP